MEYDKDDSILRSLSALFRNGVLTSSNLLPSRCSWRLERLPGCRRGWIGLGRV